MKRHVDRIDVTCDICKKMCADRAAQVEGVPRLCNGHLALTASAVDNGVAVANAGGEWDLCDSCLDAVRGAINAAAREIQRAEGDI